MKKLSKTKRTKSINNLNNLEDFINFGNLKLHKLLLKQSMVYNTEIDKIDKIIINNYDKVTPLSYKILINKEKTKKKMLEEINKFPNLKKKQIEQRNNNNYIPLKYKENQFKSSYFNKENKIKKRNNFSLPQVLSQINKTNNNNNNKINEYLITNY